MKRIAHLLAAIAVLALSPLAATAQDAYPKQPLKIFVPTTAGGTSDPLVRLLALKAQTAFGQPIVIENRTGGVVGSIATNALLSAPPDGYTAIFQTTALTIMPWLQDLPFDPQKLVPIIKTSVASYIFTVGANSPFKTFDEFVAYAKKNPRKLSCAVVGIGTQTHLALELLMKDANIEIVTVPYRGSALVYPDLASGRVDCSVEPTAGIMQFLGEGGSLRALGITQKDRWAKLPDVTPVGAIYPNVTVQGWGGLFVAKGTPPEIVRKLHTVFAQAMRDPEVVKKLMDLGLYAEVESTDAFAATIERDRRHYGDIIKARGITLEQQK